MIVYDKTYALGANDGSSAKASNQYIILHDTGNANNVGTNSAANEASYMQRNWQSAYTHAIAGWDKVYIIGEPGYVSYGAGSPANERSPFQIELARYSDRGLALKAYANWINAAREYAAKFDIPLTLDGIGNGVKTHKWVSDNLWGDHQDPYGYLASIGVSKAQLANDIAHGVSGSTAAAPDPNVIKIDTQGHGGVNLLNSKGQYLGKFLANGTRWKVAGSTVINGEEMILVGKDQYVPIKFTDWRGNVVRVIYKKGGVNLLNGSGKYLGKYLKYGTRWKVFGVKLIAGKVMYNLGGDQYIPKAYVHLEK